MKDETEIPDNNYEEQAKILISSEENPEVQASLYNYWQFISKDPNFDKKKFVQDLLDKRYSSSSEWILN